MSTVCCMTCIDLRTRANTKRQENAMSLALAIILDSESADYNRRL
jgi:hypothetical protein